MKSETPQEIGTDEVIEFLDNCPHCNSVCQTHMKPTSNINRF